MQRTQRARPHFTARVRSKRHRYGGGAPRAEHPRDAKRWRAARTLAELGELTARWLEGRISSPFYFGGPDEETLPHVATLAAVNRAGFLTEFSQPGELVTFEDGEAWRWRQRAAVSGFIGSAELLRLLLALWVAHAPELLLIVHDADGPLTSDGEPLVVTLDGDTENTWDGHWLGREWIVSNYHRPGGWSSAAAEAVCASWQVAVIDPVWGRNDVVWPLLDGLAAGRGVG